MMKLGKSLNEENTGSDDKELKMIAPKLFGMDRVNSFNVPEGYFNDLSKQVTEQIKSLPDFEAVSKDNPFTVSDGYFTSLTVAIQHRISKEKNKRNVWTELL